ncbi:MAG: hypothetical protein L6R40_000566 [Gallowayella cf. fulva]|nr:MAG: hypothetical protein L6R40_000566 [Xanthomendoza cf. fulva]
MHETRQEARTKEINLSTESLPIVRRMLKYFYVLDYEGPQADEEAKNEMGLGSKNMQNADVNDEVKGDGNDSGLHRGLANLKLDIQMYSMGDRYHIDCLRDLAASKFEMTCEHLGFSNCYDPATTFEAFIGAAATVYETTQTTRNGDWKLTPPLLNVIAWRIKSDYHFASNQYLRETCLQNAEFAYDLMRSVSSGAHASGNGTSYTWW